MAYIPPNTNGQATMANSSPVVIASDQSAVPVSAASLPLPSGASTSALQTTGNTSVASIDTKTPALGQALAAASVPVVLTAAQLTTITPPAAITGFALDSSVTTTNTEIGIVTETAPATDTASSGLNGRLQRIAQRVTSLIALFPTSLGQGTMATSMKVVLPSDQAAIPVTLTSTTVTGTVSENIAQVNGITVLTGTGATGTGSQRVTVATDSATVAGSASLPTGSNVIGALTANQSVNTAQIAGVATNVGVGAAGATGTQRVVTATDSTIGTVTAVTAITNALPAGTNLMGKVGIDQTTPGTTNRVDIGTVNSVAPAFGTGVRAATVQRVTVATDDLVPISASSLPLPALAATSTKQSDGSQKTQLVDGSGIVVGPVVVSAGNNLPIAIGATNYVASTVNSTSAQLAANATFTGTIETTFNQQSYSLLVVTDQDGTLTINQYTDAGGTQLNSAIVIPVKALVPLAQSNVVNGNFFNVTYKNLGPKTTTTLKIDIAYGTIPATTQLNNAPVSLNEIGGTALTAGQKTGALSIPVVLPTDTAGLVQDQTNRGLLEQILSVLTAQAAAQGVSDLSNPNIRRVLDNNQQEVVTLIADRSRTGKASVTLTASTTETTLINGDPQNYLDLVMVAVTNTSASTICRVDLRDTTGGTIVKSWNTVGGTPDQGFSLVGVAVPQTTKGNNWTVQCSASTTDVRVFALYALRPN